MVSIIKRNERHQIIIIISNNSSVNEIAKRIYTEIQKYNALKDKIIIRLYNLNIEKERIKYIAIFDRAENDGDPNNILINEKINVFSFNYYFYRFYKNAVDKSFGIRDKRFKIKILNLLK